MDPSIAIAAGAAVLGAAGIILGASKRPKPAVVLEDKKKRGRR